ncbi:hypothetical protein C1Y63_01225 [Corynebacterium sp. 13CS0277]|nr:hypothetical protein [Corynebacterium sp. 13CS0277]PRQ12442.1 hypothetical protein C1Y63_01225 [Corynebacterium sp. 13CS0277]
MKVEKLRKRVEKGSKKKKCCKSKPRCRCCPVVIHRLRKQGACSLDDKALKKAVKKARQW